MKYNYPIDHEDIKKIHDFISLKHYIDMGFSFVDLITTSSPSFDNENKYQNFKINVMRYLETQNIYLSKNCNNIESIHGYSPNEYSVENIVCDKSHRNFIYKTYVNKNSNCLLYTSPSPRD